MIPYFLSRERQNKLWEAIVAWEGTPYRHYCNVIGKGVDCNHYVLGVYLLAGLDLKVKFEPYPPDRHLHVAQEILLEYVEAIKCLRQMPKYKPMNGDLLLYKFGLSTSHPAIYFNDHICQSIMKSGVIRIPFKEQKFFKRLTHVYRPMEI